MTKWIKKKSKKRKERNEEKKIKTHTQKKVYIERDELEWSMCSFNKNKIKYVHEK